MDSDRIEETTSLIESSRSREVGSKAKVIKAVLTLVANSKDLKETRIESA